MRIRIGVGRTLRLADGTEVRVPFRVYALLHQDETLEEKIEILKRISWSREWATKMCQIAFADEWETLPEDRKDKCIRNWLRKLVEAGVV